MKRIWNGYFWTKLPKEKKRTTWKEVREMIWWVQHGWLTSKHNPDNQNAVNQSLSKKK